jgi:hypothetical protein
MGYNRRKLDAERKALAEAAAAARRTARLERAPGPADAHAVLADNQGRYHRALLVPVGALSGLPHHERH